MALVMLEKSGRMQDVPDEKAARLIALGQAVFVDSASPGAPAKAYPHPGPRVTSKAKRAKTG